MQLKFYKNTKPAPNTRRTFEWNNARNTKVQLY